MKQPRVRVLDDKVVNQIAAGEVVERPASVVKELVENALDAGASEITVILANGGRSAIEVLDNGCGMSKQNALMAIERFGTSKVYQIDDLQHIATFGFRGEALPSIASISRFTLASSAEDTPGVEIRLQAGVLKSVAEKSMARGTHVSVKNIFFNVPARKKFLRAANTELGAVKMLIADTALANPKVRFCLVHDGAQVVLYPAVQSFDDRVRQLNLTSDASFSVDWGRGLQDLDKREDGWIRIQGYLSHAVECVSNPGKLRILVNGRSVRDRLIIKAVREGYGSFLKSGKYPSGVLSINIDPADVDVNVHPQKTEVRFRNPSIVFTSVASAISSKLQSSSVSYYPASSVSTSEYRTFEPAVPYASSSNTQPVEVSWHLDTSVIEQKQQLELVKPSPLSEKNEAPSRYAALKDMRFVGQVCQLYLILEAPQVVAFVDMHAAHERVRYFELKEQLMEGKICSQLLLAPAVIKIPSSHVAHFEEAQPFLAQMGIEADLMSEDSVVVRAIPELLGRLAPHAIFDELFSLPSWSDWSFALEKSQDEVLARLACHSSVRSGRILQEPEVFALLEALEKVETQAFCPHGRPIVKYFREYELEKMFGRQQ